MVFSRTTQIHEFITSLSYGSMPGVIYDTAIIASLKDNIGIPRFPRQVDLICRAQRKDGSWGSDFFHPYDRLLNTVAALFMFAELEIIDEQWAMECFEKGISYLETHHHKLLKSSIAMPAAFEFLYPFLLGKIMDRTSLLTLPLGNLEKIREKKLAKVEGLIYKIPTPLLHSMEGIVEDSQSAHLLARFQSRDGSLAASPASTSVFIRYNVKSVVPAAYRYIQRIFNADGMARHFDDYLYMNIAFTLYPLLKAGYSFSFETVDIGLRLAQNWSPLGVPFGESFPIPDADDTAVAIVVLANLGAPNMDEKLATLFTYESDGHFLTYPFEIEPSIMTNMHVLDALLINPEYNAEIQIKKVLSFIKSQTLGGRYLEGNKYNASSVIQTGNLLLSLLPSLPEIAISYAEWLQDQFRWEQGMWGTQTPSVEESAHALLGLLWAKKHGLSIDDEILKRGYVTLQKETRNGFTTHDSFLWTAKVQYSPTEINRAQILSALYLHEQLFEA